jgi:hypothetical protein
MFGADYSPAHTRADLRQALRTAIGAEKPRVIEVFSDSVLHEKMRREIVKRASQQLSTKGV